MFYVVSGLDGDYANLSQILEDGTYVGDPNDTKLVARALLPENIEEGTWLRYEMFEYSIIE